MMSSVSHYNQVARNPPLQCRDMRLGHNVAKRMIIDRGLRVAGLPIESCEVMDLACGRGGDLNKIAGCKSYAGVDTAGDALTELRRRAQEIGQAVEVYHCDATVAPSRRAHLVLCNFAIHYFCDTRAHCAALLDKVAETLLPSGAFCGTYERHPTREFGVPHHAVVGDCVDAIEWRVPWDEVARMALARGLAVVYHVSISRLDGRCDPAITGFIMQQAQARYCGKTRQVSAIPGSLSPHRGSPPASCRPSS